MEVYDWIESAKNRDYLMGSRVPSLEEKIRLVCGSCRSLEAKYDAITVLASEAVSQDDRDVIESLLRLYDWAFSKLEEDRPGQIYIFVEAREHSFDDVMNIKYDGVEKLFHTNDKLQTYIREYADLYHDQFRTANIEKWGLVDGELQRILDFRLCVDHGRAFIDRFDIPRTQYKTMGICFDAQIAHTGDFRTTLPLPYKSGDLVRIDIPVLSDPVYGVLYIYEACGRYMHLAYIEDHKLKTADMSYQDVGAFSGWRVIDWMHPAQDSELPAEQNLLIQLSEYTRRKDLTAEQEQQLLMLFHSRPKNLLEGETTLAELLKERE